MFKKSTKALRFSTHFRDMRYITTRDIAAHSSQYMLIRERNL
jgi:hypothetical protein